MLRKRRGETDSEEIGDDTMDTTDSEAEPGTGAALLATNKGRSRCDVTAASKEPSGTLPTGVRAAG